MAVTTHAPGGRRALHWLGTQPEGYLFLAPWLIGLFGLTL